MCFGETRRNSEERDRGGRRREQHDEGSLRSEESSPFLSTFQSRAKSTRNKTIKPLKRTHKT
jgi:hypothetical protein